MAPPTPRRRQLLVLLVTLTLVVSVAPGGVLGASTASVNGTVVNEQYEPLPDATVTLLAANSNEVVATTTTAQDGSYVFSQVDPGDYDIEAEYDSETGHATTTVESVATTTADVVIVGVTPNSTTTGSVSGLVSNVSDTPLPNAAVHLVDASSGSEVASTTTSQDGRYTFTGVEIGTYSVEAVFDGASEKASSVTVEEDRTATADIVITSADDTPEASVSVTAPDTIAPGATANVTFTIRNSGSKATSTGGLQLNVTDQDASVVDVSGDGFNAPDRFFTAELQPDETWTVTYTVRAAENASGSVVIGSNAAVGTDSTARTVVWIQVQSQPKTLAEHLRKDDGKIGFQELLDVMNAYSDDTEIAGYGTVEFRAVLDTIDAYNTET